MCLAVYHTTEPIDFSFIQVMPAKDRSNAHTKPHVITPEYCEPPRHAT
jgi:hypothetical protein